MCTSISSFCSFAFPYFIRQVSWFMLVHDCIIIYFCKGKERGRCSWNNPCLQKESAQRHWASGDKIFLKRFSIDLCFLILNAKMLNILIKWHCICLKREATKKNEILCRLNIQNVWQRLPGSEDWWKDHHQALRLPCWLNHLNKIVLIHNCHQRWMHHHGFELGWAFLMLFCTA